MVGGLAHVALGAEQHVERTVHFYAELLGLAEVARRESTVFLSGGRSSSYDLAIGPGPAGMDHFAFEVVDAGALGELRTGLSNAGVEVADLDLDHEPGIASGCALVLPSGHRMELVVPEHPGVFRGTPTVDPRNAKGAGPVALEHLTIDCPGVETVGRFLIDRLGFRATEVSAPPSGGWFLAFMRTRDLHHDLGLFSNWAFDGPGFNHVGFTVAGAGDLVRAADAAYRLGAARSGHQRPGVGGGDADAAGACGGERVAVGAAEVEGMAHHGHADAVLTGPLHGESHRLIAGELSQCVVGIEDGDRPVLAHHLGLLAPADRASA